LSIWSSSVILSENPPLTNDLQTEVAIIGGGIAGILTAYYLKKKGIDCVILEKNRIAGGTTKNTTAKITSQHGRIYHRLIKSFGEEKARQYAYANTLAIDEYERIIKEEQFTCHFERTSSYLYTTDDLKGLISEADACKKLGIDSYITDKTSLPFEIEGALCFENQAQFHPLEFIREIAKKLVIYENTVVTDVQGKKVYTPNAVVTANHIVFACHYPFINRIGHYYLKMHQSMSYVVAILTSAKLFGIYRQDKEDGLTLRSYENDILFGGMGHRTGVKCPENVYSQLIHLAKIYFPQSELKDAWSTLDCMTHDYLPYIGRISQNEPNLYVATGFNKWGISNSLVAGMMISDMISGKKNPFEDVYSPERINVVPTAKNLIIDGATMTASLIKENLTIPQKELSEVKNGSGAVINLNDEKVGVYKDQNGKTYVVSTKCPHLGCELQWNKNDLTWDCPCHGSRFGYDGICCNNPANTNLSCQIL